MNAFSILVLCIGCFLVGWIFGALLLAHEALRPGGYVTRDGRRIRMTVDRPQIGGETIQSIWKLHNAMKSEIDKKSFSVNQETKT